MCRTTCITTYKMTVHLILSYSLLSDTHKGIRSHSSLIPSLQFQYNAGLIPRLHYTSQYDHLNNTILRLGTDVKCLTTDVWLYQ